MNRAEQKEQVIAALRRRAQIAEETRARLSELDQRGGDDALLHVDPDVRVEAEEEYSASIGRRRYVTSDGRVVFLTPEEISLRRRAKARSQQRAGQVDAMSDQTRRRQRVVWAFNVGVVLLAVAIGWMLLR
jgi:hypothetical protein